MTTIMSPAMTKAQVHTVAGSQPYVLGRSKGISSQSEGKKTWERKKIMWRDQKGSRKKKRPFFYG